MSVHTDAYSVSRACATSFRAVANVAESLMAGTIRAGIAGGADSSSVLPVGVSKTLARALVDANKARTLSQKLKLFSRLRPRDLLPVPGGGGIFNRLTDGRYRRTDGEKLGISREQQDALAHRSHQLAAKAGKRKAVRGGDDRLCAPFRQPLEQDNNIRKNSTLADYQSYARPSTVNMAPLPPPTARR